MIRAGNLCRKLLRKYLQVAKENPKNYGLIKEKNFTTKMSKNSSSCILPKMKKNRALSNDGNRTMREKMFKFVTANSTRRYIDVLESIVARYSDTRHSSIKMSPKDASMTK